MKVRYTVKDWGSDISHATSTVAGPYESWLDAWDAARILSEVDRHGIVEILADRDGDGNQLKVVVIHYYPL